MCRIHGRTHPSIVSPLRVQTADTGECSRDEFQNVEAMRWLVDDSDDEEIRPRGRRGDEVTVLQAEKMQQEINLLGHVDASGEEGSDRHGRGEGGAGGRRDWMTSSKLTERIGKQGLGRYLDASYTESREHSPHVRFALESRGQGARAKEHDDDNIHDRETADDLHNLGGAALSRIREIASMVQSVGAAHADAKGHTGETIQEGRGCMDAVGDDVEEATYLAQVLELPYSEVSHDSSSAVPPVGTKEGEGRDKGRQSELSRIKGLARSGSSGRGQHQPRRRENVPGRATGTDAPEGDGGVLVQRFGGGGQGDPSDRGAGKARAATVRHAPSMDDDGWIRCGS